MSGEIASEVKMVTNLVPIDSIGLLLLKAENKRRRKGQERGREETSTEQKRLEIATLKSFETVDSVPIALNCLKNEFF